jgi:hypothetical protein
VEKEEVHFKKKKGGVHLDEKGTSAEVDLIQAEVEESFILL